MIPQNAIRYETRTGRHGEMEVVGELSVRWLMNELQEGTEPGSPPFVKEQELREKCKNGVFTFLYGDMRDEIQQIDKAFQAVAGGPEALPPEARLAFMRLYRMFEGFKVDTRPLNITIAPETPRARDFEREDNNPPWVDSPRSVSDTSLVRPRRIRIDEEQAAQDRAIMRFGQARETSEPENPARLQSLSEARQIDNETNSYRVPAPVSPPGTTGDQPTSMPVPEAAILNERPPTIRRTRNQPARLERAMVAAVAESSPFSSLVEPVREQTQPATRRRTRFG